MPLAYCGEGMISPCLAETFWHILLCVGKISATLWTRMVQMGKTKNFLACNLWRRIATYIYEDSNCCYGVIPTPTAEVTISGDDS
jgi:hypothetical protein